jgi:23S rRNA (guanosine2251-2'-O)-methyltransferase
LIRNLKCTVVENGKTIVLILDQISDARNFGAIIRTAEHGVGIIVQKDQLL